MNASETDLLLSFYGDDFTGSTDVMESLALNGIPTALFLVPPDAERLKRFQLKRKVGGEQLAAFGVAGIARSLPPAEMEPELERVFAAIAQVPSRFFHYKVCSTLDSSPEVGNIGLAMTVAQRHFPSAYIPFVVGAPFLNRFVVFGNLFARIGSETFRLDRHPVMAHHPVTPMRESDVGRHLAAQSERGFVNFDLHAMDLPKEARLRAFQEQLPTEGELVIFDTLYDEQLAQVGELIYQHPSAQPQLLAGSSGVSFALARYLQAAGTVATPAQVEYAQPADQMLAVAGSCSPVTDRQIAHVLQLGFADLPLQVDQLLDASAAESEIQRVLAAALAAISAGKSPMIYSARGPQDPSIQQMQGQLGISGAGKRIGEALGRLTRSLLEQSNLRRVMVAGGDTSGAVARALEIVALETVCPIAPGSPLCLAHSQLATFDGLEISLKGGQVGKDDYFEAILQGRPLS
ncbi:MAG: four-carbon acid sugar kinase family protein [Bacteroidota bacterium]